MQRLSPHRVAAGGLLALVLISFPLLLSGTLFDWRVDTEFQQNLYFLASGLLVELVFLSIVVPAWLESFEERKHQPIREKFVERSTKIIESVFRSNDDLFTSISTLVCIHKSKKSSESMRPAYDQIGDYLQQWQEYLKAPQGGQPAVTKKRPEPPVLEVVSGPPTPDELTKVRQLGVPDYATEICELATRFHDLSVLTAGSFSPAMMNAVVSLDDALAVIKKRHEGLRHMVDDPNIFHYAQASYAIVDHGDLVLLLEAMVTTAKSPRTELTIKGRKGLVEPDKQLERLRDLLAFYYPSALPGRSLA